jgi:hypothetical protein
MVSSLQDEDYVMLVFFYQATVPTALSAAPDPDLLYEKVP